MLHRHHTAQSLGPSLCDWKSTFLRPLTGWNLSFEDIKSSILATGACDTTKDPWSRKDKCFKHNEEEGETSVNPLMHSTHSCSCVFPQKPRLYHQNDSYEKTTREHTDFFFFNWLCVLQFLFHTHCTRIKLYTEGFRLLYFTVIDIYILVPR